jgi:hypothetical protein
MVSEWYPRSEVLLLSYIAVVAEFRGRGIGGTLLTAIPQRWAAELWPRLIVMEVENPRHYHDSTFGDPDGRVRLYERLGARCLPVPYLQPALGPAGHRVPHLLLMVLGGSQAPPGSGRVNGQTVEQFLREYFEECEGPPRPGDTELERMLAACRQDGGLPLLQASDLPNFEDG